MNQISPENREMIGNIADTEKNLKANQVVFESVVQAAEDTRSLEELKQTESMRDKVSLLVVRGFGPNRLTPDGEKAKQELANMGLDLPLHTEGFLLSEIVTNLLEQLEKKNEQ